ncbi:MAG: dTMP kinase [Firmicutes bacterium]|uniref:Thymidylate kinase n=1 Tax=Geochorda subterranea TaxID=3109564 RepID=A0ABZ1BQ76_9FIRM|nr:dTMP kinase [Limnochorda sp. LNt]NLG68662.1 dTMP kinase [Bacillota bacterium]WRP14257.1 dTMP kinase [Limnochorda sp. LNt]
MSPRGLLITLEGLDGTGKSTQARSLAAWLRRRGLQVRHTFEPGGTALGRRLRTLLLRGGEPEGIPVPEAELLLLMADRAQHVAQVLRPWLERGAVVVCERYADSSVAYQVFGSEVDGELVERLNRWVTGGLQPDLTFWLDLPVGQRLPGAGAPERDRIESRGEAFFRRVREGYAALAARYPERIVRVEVTGKPRRAVQSELRDVVVRRLGERLQELGWEAPVRR